MGTTIRSEKSGAIREHSPTKQVNRGPIEVLDLVCVADPAPATRWMLVDLERYEVTSHGTTVGFIDVVGNVYVALAGVRADHAVEVAQTLTFEGAVSALDGFLTL